MKIRTDPFMVSIQRLETCVMTKVRILEISQTKKMNHKNHLKSVAIYLRGHELDPTDVSKVLGVRPTRSQKRRGFKPGSNKFVAKIGVWTLKVKSESRSVTFLVDALFKKLGNPRIKLDEIKGVEEANLDLLVASDDRATDRLIEFSLTQRQIAKASQLGLSFCITVI